MIRGFKQQKRTCRIRNELAAINQQQLNTLFDEIHGKINRNNIEKASEYDMNYLQILSEHLMDSVNQHCARGEKAWEYQSESFDLQWVSINELPALIPLSKRIRFLNNHDKSLQMNMQQKTYLDDLDVLNSCECESVFRQVHLFKLYSKAKAMTFNLTSNIGMICVKSLNKGRK
eukprot:100195_1